MQHQMHEKAPVAAQTTRYRQIGHKRPFYQAYLPHHDFCWGFSAIRQVSTLSKALSKGISAFILIMRIIILRITEVRTRTHLTLPSLRQPLVSNASFQILLAPDVTFKAMIIVI
ncbi:hypothetical protein FRC18_008286 [Serendipita sp. 400]|nr:hypothetical protein FRC18_008286 [Serendipita sp. 400]